MMLQFQTLYQDDYILIEEAQTERYLKLTWLQHLDTDRFKRIARKIPSLMEDRGNMLMLSNNRKMLFLDMAGQNFLLQHVYPFFSKAERLYLAHVVSPATYDMMDIYRIADTLKENPEQYHRLETNIFLSYESAQDWLLEKGKQQIEVITYAQG